MGSVRSSWWQVEVLAGFLIHHFVEMWKEGVHFITAPHHFVWMTSFTFLHHSSKPSFTVHSFLGFRRNYGITPENNLYYYRSANILLKHLTFFK